MEGKESGQEVVYTLVAQSKRLLEPELLDDVHMEHRVDIGVKLRNKLELSLLRYEQVSGKLAVVVECGTMVEHGKLVQLPQLLD